MLYEYLLKEGIVLFTVDEAIAMGLGVCEGQSYVLNLNHWAWEVHETKMPLVCRPLAQGQIFWNAGSNAS